MKILQGNKSHSILSDCIITGAFVFFFILVSSVAVYGQKIAPSPADLYATAEEYMFADDYREALPVLLGLADKGYNSANISYKIGECYLNIPGQKTRALPYLKEAAMKISGEYTGVMIDEPNAPAKALLYLGVAYRLNNDLDNAVSSFTDYLNSLAENDAENRALALYHIDRCLNAHELIAAPAKFSSDTLPEVINSQISNFNPLLTFDEKVLYYINKLQFYDAVMHAVKVDSAWQKPVNLTPEIKSDGDHYITGMSADGTVLLLTSYDPYRSGEIFTTEFKDDMWSELQRLNGNVNTLFNESHASFSPDGKFLYFTSDRRGGYGGLDIYRSERNASGEWGPAMNMGPLINTPYNEESPFVTANPARLFFSSQGHYNMGGYDIFCAAADAHGQWLPPVNIGYPLNTTDDDVFFFPLNSGKIGYQARFNRYTSLQDIVRYSISDFGKPARYTLQGSVEVKSEPGYDPSGIAVHILNKEKGDTLALQRLKSNGTFVQKLPAGEFVLDFSDDKVSLLRKELNIPDYFPQDDLILNASLTIHPVNAPSDTFWVKDLYFDFDKSLPVDYSNQYLGEVSRMLSKYPGISVRVNGYTDELGSESYNLLLSRKRADFVANHLKNSISETLSIVTGGYGEASPVAVNHNSDGTDNPEGRKYNRRVELLFEMVPDGVILIRQSDIPGDIRIR
ncbi:MAG TPA: OmpA family protein [Bacteroidales bacterium]|nr:OmpA family protein [Bacteroidales bacterium]